MKIRPKQTYIWVTQKLPQICSAILRICIGNVAWFAVYTCGNFWVTQYILGRGGIWIEGRILFGKGELVVLYTRP